ncbi:MAG: hypothetical protein KY461_05385 [Actinobacteria bacterium]|nr:hypothetical protein [Actinomycetota bacterium]
MTSITADAADTRRADPTDPAFQAFTLLRVGFTVAPILFGLDKFTEVMVDWSTYLWSGVVSVLPGSADAIMLGVGVVEIAAGVLVAVRPRIGGYVVAAWLAGIIVNLLLVGGFLDIALRDVGLLIGALALARLAAGFPATGTPGTASR